MSVSNVPVARAVAELHAAGRSVATMLGWLLFGLGWVVAKMCRMLLSTAAGVLFSFGWVAGRLVRPALLWSAAAVRLGWDEGRKPMGGQRGAA